MAAPNPPTNLSYPGTDGDGLVLSIAWDASDGGADGYELERDVDGGGYAPVIDQAETTYEDSVDAVGTYKWRVRAYNWLVFPYSKEYSDYCYFGGDPPDENTCVVAIPIPAGIYYPDTDADGQYDVNWDSCTEIDSYELERDDGGGYVNVYTGGDLTTPQTVLVGSYLYRVRCTNRLGNGNYRTGDAPCVVAVPAPASITYGATSPNGAYQVTWDTEPSATNYVLERSDDGGLNWTEAYSGVGTWYDETVLEGSYRYRVKAQNAAGDSDWQVGDEHDIVVSVPAPASITYPANAVETVSVTWAAEPSATSYDLQRSADGGGTWAPVASPVGNSYDDAPGAGSFTYQVRAVNAAGVSDWTTGDHPVVVTLGGRGPVLCNRGMVW